MSDIRPPFRDEREYVLNSWREAYRYAPGGRCGRWRDYEARITPLFNGVLDRDDTRVLVKHIENVIVGWIVFARGIHADTVHWIQTRYRVGTTGMRRRGTMRELVEAAELKSFVAYTFRGETGTMADGEFVSRGKGERRVTSDTWIVPWLMRRRIGAAFLDYKQWSAR